MRGARGRWLSVLLIVALMAVLAPPAFADPADDAAAAVQETMVVSLDAPLTLGASSWSWGPSTICSIEGGRSGVCGWSASGGYGSAAGAGPGCLAAKRGTGGSGTLTVYPDDPGAPAVPLSVTDFGWEVAEGRQQGEVALLSGRWSDGEHEGRLSGFVAATALSSTDCGMYATSARPRAVLVLTPSAVPDPPDNAAPGVPVLVAPADGHDFAADADKQLVVRAVDNEEDPYLGEIEVAKAPGAWPAFALSLLSTPAASDAESTVLLPVAVEGDYQWRARACDPSGSGDCGGWSAWRGFSVQPSTVDDARETAASEAEGTRLARFEAPMTFGANSWTWGESTSCEYRNALGETDYCEFDASGAYGPTAGVGGGCLAEHQGRDGEGTLRLYSGGSSTELTLDLLEWRVAEGRVGAEAAVVSGRWRLGDAEGRVHGLVTVSSTDPDCATYATAGKPRVALQLLPETVPVPEGNDPPDTPTLVSPEDGQRFAWDEDRRFVIATSDPDEDPYYGQVEVTRTDPVEVGEAEEEVPTVTLFTTPAALGSAAAAVLPPLQAGGHSWRARACDPSGSGECSDWSASRTFTVDPSPAEEEAAEVEFEIAQTRTLELQLGMSFGADSWTWSHGSCQFVSGDGQGVDDSCSMSASGSYGPAAGVGGGCLAQRQGRDGEGTLTINELGKPPVTLDVDVLEWRVAEGRRGAETATVSGRWVRGLKEGRISGLMVNATLANDCTMYATAGKPRAVLQLFPAGVPAPEGNDPPVEPTLVSPADGRSYSWDDDKRLEVRATDANADPYHAVVEVRSLQRALTFTLAGTPANSDGHSFTFAPALEAGQYQWRAQACDPSGSGECSDWSHDWADAPDFTVQPSVAEDAADHAGEDAAQVRSFTVRAPLTLGASSWSWGPGGSCGPTAALSGSCSLSLSGGYGAAAGAGPGCFTQKKGVNGSGSLTAYVAGTTPVTLSITDFGWSVAEGRAGSEVAILSGRWTSGNRHGRIDGIAASRSTSTNCALYAGGGAPDAVLDFVPDDLVVGGGTQVPPDAPLLVTPDTGQTWWATDRQTFRINATDDNRDFYIGEVQVRPVAADGTPGTPLAPFATTPSRSGLSSEGVPGTPLAAGRYEWQARASDPAGSDTWGPWSSWRAFTVADTSDLPAMIVPSSDRAGLEQFYPYRDWKLGGPVRAFANLGTGNLVVQGRGVEVPGPLALRVTHTYNAVHDAVDGPIGKGWTLGIQEFEGDGDALSALLALDLSGALTILTTDDRFEFVDADGTRHAFLKGGLAGPGWHSPPGVNLTVFDGVDGSGNRWYHAVRPDGVRYEFTLVGAAHRLTAITDRKGNQLTFAYSSGKLSTVTDSSSRTLTLIWSGSRVTTVRYTASSSTFDVVYNVNASGRLTSVTRAATTAAAQATTFAYTAGTGLTGVTDARGNTTTFGYTAGQVTSVTDRAGKVWELRYGDACAPGRDAGITPVCVEEPPDTGSADGAVTTYQISAQGNLLEQRDAGDVDEAGQPRRNSRSFVWSDNRLRRMTDEVGTVIDYDYNAFGQVTRQAVTPVAEAAVVTELDYVSPSPGVGDLREARVAAGSAEQRTWKFGYDAGGKGLLVSQVDPAGAATTFSHYASRGFLKTVTDPRGNSTTYGNTALADGGYHASGQPTRITDPTGAFLTLTYDFLGRVTQKVDRLAKTWNSTYDLRGNLLSESNPANTAAQTTRYCYDANDNRTHVIKPKAASGTCTQTGTEGYVTRTDYDARDLPTVTTTSSGTQIRKTKQVYAPDGQVTETLYPRSFNPATGAELTDPAQIQKITYAYFPNNRAKAFVDPEGHQTDLLYTPDGRVRQVTEPRHDPTHPNARRTTVSTYNFRGQQTAVLVSGQPAPTRNEYNAHGELVRTTSSAGRVTQYAYDAMGRRTRVIDAHGRASERTYDAAGNLTSVTQPVGSGGTLTTSYGYTARNEIASESDPADAKHSILYTYDAEGRQTLRRDKNNTFITRSVQETRRADGLVTERVSSFAATTTGQHKATFAYDAHGNPTAVNTYLDGSATPNVSAITATYTTADEVATWDETLYTTSGTAIAKASSYTYAPDGALASRTVDGQTTAYTHWRNGLEKTTVPWGSAGTISTAWMPAGVPASQSSPGGVSTSFTYDMAGRPSSKRVADGAVSLSAWQQVVYDGDGNRTGEVVSQLQPNGTLKLGTGTYAYDQLGRLVQAKQPLETARAVTYVLDDAGNIIRDNEGDYAYAHNRLTSAQFRDAGPFDEMTSTFGFDQHGNMAERRDVPEDDDDPRTETSYRYDGAGQTTRVKQVTTVTVEDPLLGDFEVEFESTVRHVYDAFGRMVRRHQSGDDIPTKTVLVFHDRDSAQPVVEVAGDASVTTRYVLDSVGEPLGQWTSAGFGWYVTDLRRNLTQLLDGTGAVKAVYGYDPFGRTRPDLISTTGGWDSRLRFQLARQDETLGVYTLGPRLFDPAINRFVGADFYVAAEANMALAVDPLTGNRYLYAGANPVGMIDDGHWPCWSCWKRKGMGWLRGLGGRRAACNATTVIGGLASIVGIVTISAASGGTAVIVAVATGGTSVWMTVEYFRMRCHVV
jgi:RHS repeat-associated protein